MQGLSSEALLRAWEACSFAPAWERPLAVLEAAGEDYAVVAELPIGVRDARLLELRARTFGPMLELVVECPACHDQLELALEIARLIESTEPMPARTLALPDGTSVELRLLTSLDVSEAARLGDPILVHDELAARALVDRRELDPAGQALVAERLSELDPTSDIVLAATCPSCAHVWDAPLDAAAHVTAEVTAAGERLLRQVSILARAFGWTEPTVLALSPIRRRAYLELAETMLGAASSR